MNASEVLHALLRWTPFLAGGFGWNIIISLVAMGIGSAIGAWLALQRLSSRPRTARLGAAITEFMRNTPTIVCQFYLVFMLPVELTLPWSDQVLPFPSWFKATLALAMAVAGFVSDNLAPALKEARNGNHTQLRLLLPNWTGYFVLIVIASSSASVIGVDELVSRCNTVINATGRTQMMLWVYLYAMLWFFLFSYSLTQLIKSFGGYLGARREKLQQVDLID